MRRTAVGSDTESALLDRLRAGEEEAFDAIYAQFNPRLFNFLARLTGRRDVAEELLEETWLRLVRHRARFEPDVQIGPWLFAVARNLSVSYFRTRTVESRVIGSLSLWPERRAETPFDMTALNEFERRVEAGLAALPPLLREALLLTAVEGLSPSEAAAICDVTPEAMRQRVRRARTALAGQLGDIASEWRLRTGA